MTNGPHSGDLKRFTFFERIIHWVVGLTFVFLVLTGLAFSYPKLFWINSLVGGGPTARWLHPWMGVVFTVGLVFMFFLWVKDMGMGKADWEWMGSIKHYALHEKDQVPATAKYNGGQKGFFWGMVIFGVAHVITGVPLWFPETFGTSMLPLMRFLHFLVTVPGVLLLILHVYLGTVLFPGTARGILHGTVSRGWAKLHHPLWYKEKTGS